MFTRSTLCQLTIAFAIVLTTEGIHMSHAEPTGGVEWLRPAAECHRGDGGEGWGESPCRASSVCLGVRDPAEQGSDAEEGGSGL